MTTQNDPGVARGHSRYASHVMHGSNRSRDNEHSLGWCQTSSKNNPSTSEPAEPSAPSTPSHSFDVIFQRHQPCVNNQNPKYLLLFINNCYYHILKSLEIHHYFEICKSE